MNVYEYQAKELLKPYGVHVLKGVLVEHIDEAAEKASTITTDVIMVKAQVYAGGRGKAGGVKLAHSHEEAVKICQQMLGMQLITPQTGKNGVPVKKVYFEEGCSISEEYYLSLVVDRKNKCISLIASKEGGVEIESIAQKNPEAILTIPIDPLAHLRDYQIRQVLEILDVPKAAHQKMEAHLKSLYSAFINMDCDMLEVNPLVLTQSQEIVVLDAKINFDDNALYRQPSISLLRDSSESDSKEIQAAGHGLSYVALDGTIGCLVNGAGLAMATMDSIYSEGGQPANFLDVGGSATVKNVTEALRIILSDQSVQGIFINIFGGIMQCDTIAKGIIQAAKAQQIDVPMVVRLEGNQAQEGTAILKNSSLNIATASSLDDGAATIVKMIQTGGVV